MTQPLAWGGEGEGGEQQSTCIYKPRPGTQTGTILPHMMSSAVSSGGGEGGGG
jgi:hypothetical protein